MTVLGSSDQVLDMYLRGSYSITAFDINPLTKYYLNLKIAAILSDISLDEYLEFFCYTNASSGKNGKIFNQETFKKIKHNLNEPSLIFWSKIFDQYKDQIKIPNRLFKKEELKYEILKSFISYLDEDNFKLLKERIVNKKIKFINNDIKNIHTSIKETYDFIYLSNIIQYTSLLFKIRTIDENKRKIYELSQYKKLIMQLSKFLNNNGIIVAGYIYEPLVFRNEIAIFDGLIRNKVFNKNEFDIKKIVGIDPTKIDDEYGLDGKITDEIIIYRKK